MLNSLFCVCLLVFVSSTYAESLCGSRVKSSAFLANDTVLQNGAWPWIVSLHDIKTDGFICGGTLIGSNIVLTVS